MIYTEENYEPNVTCPWCQEDTTPKQEIVWEGWGLDVRQTCPQCGRSWHEIWHLVRVVCDQHKEGAMSHE